MVCTVDYEMKNVLYSILKCIISMRSLMDTDLYVYV